MYTYTSTSRIRRKIKTKLGEFKTRIQEDLCESLHQISTVDNKRLNSHLRKLRLKGGSNTSLDSCGESDNISFTSTDTR